MTKAWAVYRHKSDASVFIEAMKTDDGFEVRVHENGTYLGVFPEEFINNHYEPVEGEDAGGL